MWTEKNTAEVRSGCEKITGMLKSDKFQVSSVTHKEKKRNPAPPFTTSSLQQEAARKLNFRAKKTMMVAQQLYEGIDLGKEGTVGLITYMRTDSTRISEVAKTEANQYIREKFGENYLRQEERKEKNRQMPRMHTKGSGQQAFSGIRVRSSPF